MSDTYVMGEEASFIEVAQAVVDGTYAQTATTAQEFCQACIVLEIGMAETMREYGDIDGWLKATSAMDRDLKILAGTIAPDALIELAAKWAAKQLAKNASLDIEIAQFENAQEETDHV